MATGGDTGDGQGNNVYYIHRSSGGGHCVHARSRVEPGSVKMTGDRLQGKVWAAAIIGVFEGKAKEGREEFRIG